jgi:hypothetical protein
MTPRSITIILLASLFLTSFAAGCGEKSSANKPSGDAPSPAAAAPAPAAAAAAKHNLKTKLTKKQLDDVWASMKGNHDFKNHTKTVTDKLGAPAKVEGDKSTWYGYDAASDDCEALSTSATKGSGTSATSGAGACWD